MEIHSPDIYGAIKLATAPGTLGQVIVSQGAGVQPIWGGGVLTIAGTPTLSGLTPGSNYLITGLSQGTLGTFAALTEAKSATELGEAVTVFPATEAKSYVGLIDWADAQLTWVKDTRNNDVAGKTNISVFPWFKVGVVGNVVSSDSIISIGGASFAGVFRDNIVRGGSSVTLAAAAYASALITISDNRIDLGSGITINPAPSVAMSIDFNGFDGGVLVVSNAKTTLTVANNSVIGGTLVIDGVATAAQQINNNNIYGSITLTDIGNLFASGITILTNTVITFVCSSGAGTSSLQNIFIYAGGALNVNVTSAMSPNKLTIGASSLLTSHISGTAVAGHTMADTIVQKGIIDTRGFDCNRVLIQNTTTTLVGNVTDAVKTFYPNALP